MPCNPATPSFDTDAEHSPGSTVAQDPFGIVGMVLDGRYHIQRVVGRGGFSVVYRAHHLGFAHPVAVKVLKAPVQEAGFASAFRSEGRILLELSPLHPAIVHAMEMGTAVTRYGESPYLILEWLEGITLAAELRWRRNRKAQPFALGQALCLLEPLARGLAVAHEHGIVHRDIKPANTFVAVHRGKISVKILDFGLAKVVDEVTSTARSLVDTAGEKLPLTPAYAAPEQWDRRLGATGPWTDVYSLALMLVEVLCGAPVLDGRSSSELMSACLDASRRPSPRRCGVAVPDEVERAFSRALALEPKKRFRDVMAFWGALGNAALSMSSAPPRDVEAEWFADPDLAAALAGTLRGNAGGLPERAHPNHGEDQQTLSSQADGHRRRAPELDATPTGRPVTGARVGALHRRWTWVVVMVPALGALALHPAATPISYGSPNTASPSEGSSATSERSSPVPEIVREGTPPVHYRDTPNSVQEFEAPSSTALGGTAGPAREIEPDDDIHPAQPRQPAPRVRRESTHPAPVPGKGAVLSQMQLRLPMTGVPVMASSSGSVVQPSPESSATHQPADSAVSTTLDELFESRGFSRRR